MHVFSRPLIALSMFAGVLLLGACDSQTTTVATPTASEQTEKAAALPTGLFSSEPLAGIQTLLNVKESASAGDSVTFVANIAGRAEPFTEGRAIMLVADLALQLCTEDHCATPYDACCEPIETITEHTATVQVIDKQDRPLKIGLKGQGSLEPGAEVQVRGTVHQAGDGYFVINAQTIHVPG